jgi:parallel beta-helix repeat protein
VSILILSAVSSVSTIPSKPITITLEQDRELAQDHYNDTIVITSNADFALLGASGVGTRSDPYILENLNIASEEICIEVTGTTAYFVIRNSKLLTGYQRVEHMPVMSDISNFPAILFQNVENGKVVQCEISGSESGIQIFNSLDCSVTESLVYDCWNGVHMYFTVNCSIYRNRIHNNQRGVLFENADFCEILNNSIYSNWENGLELAFYSENNTIYGNSIGWNDVSGGQEGNAFDMGENNTFDDGLSLGNFWSDYNESEPYEIPGNMNSTDRFAQLLVDTDNPIIDPYFDTVIDVESTGNRLTWTTSELFPESYLIREVDRGHIESETSGIWNGGEITYDLDHLEVGSYNITLILYDGAGNVGMDHVFVSVVSFILGGIGTELVMIASGITVVCFVTIIILVKKLS